MLLESLHELVEKLRDRIEAHGDALRKNEIQTRYALIDPLLRELGWDIEDPAQVRPEYPLETKYSPATNSADYALLSGGKVAVIVEAKRLGTSLEESVRQTVNYCNLEGTEHFAVTDGRHWEIYGTHLPGPIEQKRIVDFDLRRTDTARICLDALVLWRPSVQSGHVALAKAPVVGIPHDHTSTTSSPVAVEAIPQPTTIVPDPHDWQELSSVTAEQGQRPVEMLFPDNGRVAIKNWASAPVEAVRWLTDQGFLGISDCPIMANSSRAFRYMVHTEPVHSNGKTFTVPRKVGGLYVEAHDNQPMLLTKTKFIIERAGQDPARFKIRLS